MNKQISDKKQIAAQIEEAIKKYTDIKQNTANEIAGIKQQLSDIGVPGSIIVKLKPIWQNDITYALRKEIANLEIESS